MDWAAARSEKWRRHLAGLETMLAPVDGPLIDALSLDAPVRVVDAGCGSGATTVEALRRAPAGSVVHGFDLSPALIEVARRRQAEQGPSLAFDVADMGVDPPPGQRYDRLVSRFGVMFFKDPLSAFANLRCWLVPRGRFAFAVWGPVEDNPWMAASRAAVEETIGHAPNPASEPGAFRYGDVAPLLSLLARAGFVDVTAASVRLALPVGGRLSAPDAARFALSAFSTFADQLSKAGGDATDRACDALTARFQPYEQNGAVVSPARVHIVSGIAGER
jgi:SAM-dependent methyltransferase